MDAEEQHSTASCALVALLASAARAAWPAPAASLVRAGRGNAGTRTRAASRAARGMRTAGTAGLPGMTGSWGAAVQAGGARGEGRWAGCTVEGRSGSAVAGIEGYLRMGLECIQKDFTYYCITISSAVLFYSFIKLLSSFRVYFQYYVYNLSHAQLLCTGCTCRYYSMHVCFMMIDNILK